MRHVALAMTAMTAMLIAVPAFADVPIPIPVHNYYGPVRACQPGGAPAYMIDAVAGEGVTISTGVVVWQPGGSLMIQRSGGYDDAHLADLVRPMGDIELPGAGRLRRISIGSRNDARRAVHYLLAIDGGGPPYSSHYDISATRFDGTDRDLTLLRRIRFGEAARAACADVPPALAATPAREDDLAFWLDPASRNGPMTMCVGDVALDVRAGERAQLPWLPDRSFFRVLKGGRVAGVEANRPLQVLAGGPGALADNPALVLLPGADPGWGGAPILRAPGSRYLRLMWRAETVPGHRAMAPVTALSFDAGTSDADQTLLARRLYAKTPKTSCFNPDMP